MIEQASLKNNRNEDMNSLRERIVSLERDLKEKTELSEELRNELCDSRLREEKLRTGEKHLRSLYAAMSDLVFVIDLDGCFSEYFQPSLPSLYDSPEKFMGKRFDSKFPHDFAGKLTEAIEQINKTGEIQQFEYPLDIAGEKKWYSANLSNVHDKAGNIDSYLVVAHDITERKTMEETLKNSELKYRELTDLLPQIVFELDLKGNFTFANRFGLESTGYTQEDIDKGINVLQLFIPEEREKIRENIQKILNGIAFEGHEYTILRKDGSTFHALTFANAIIRENKPVGVRGIVLNISVRKETEKGLKEAYNIINRSPVVLFLWKNEEGWPVEFVSDNVQKLFGYTEAEFISGRVSYVESIHPEDQNRVTEEIINYSKEKGIIEFDHKPYRIVTKDGKVNWVDDRTKIRRDEKGRITHYQGIIVDITNRKIAEDKLKQQNEFILNAINSLTHPFYVIDASDFTIKLANSASGLTSTSELTTCHALTHRTNKPCDSKEHLCPLNKVKISKIR